MYGIDQRRDSNNRNHYDERFYTPRASALPPSRSSQSSVSSHDKFYTPRPSTTRSQSSNVSLATARTNLSSASESSYKTTRSTFSRTSFSSPSHYYSNNNSSNRPPNPASRYSDSNRQHTSALDREMDLEAANSSSMQHLASPVHRRGNAQKNNDRQNTNQDIFSLARHARISEVEELLIRGVPITSKDENGNTILSIGCQNGSKRIAKLALRFGADINEQNESGNTALHYCSLYQKTSLGNYLIQKGADITIRNNEGRLYSEVNR